MTYKRQIYQDVTFMDRRSSSWTDILLKFMDRRTAQVHGQTYCSSSWTDVLHKFMDRRTAQVHGQTYCSSSWTDVLLKFMDRRTAQVHGQTYCSSSWTDILLKFMDTSSNYKTLNARLLARVITGCHYT
jgi:hypothetical protein